ncbi:MAG: nucleotidyltransferase domain-containing protein [candidate division WOR-3 bacterium]
MRVKGKETNLRTDLPHLSAKEVQIIDEVLRCLKRRYRRSLKQVILYGLNARRDATGESDIDLLVVLSKAADFWRTLEGMGEIAEEILLRDGVLVSALPVDGARLRERRASPFFMNVKREGIAIYGPSSSS